MKYNSSIDNITAQKWGLNISQAYIFDWIYSLPSWADKLIQNEEIYYFASRNLACKELPLLTDKADTIYRYFRQLEGIGVVKYKKINGKDYLKLTEKGRLWNRFSEAKQVKTKVDNSEINPNSEMNPSKLGNKSESNSEINPTYNNTIIDNNTIDKSILLSDVSPSEVKNFELDISFYKVTKAFYDLFCDYSVKVTGKKNKRLREAKFISWYDDTKLLINNDNNSIDELRDVYNFLKSSTNDFWISTISSMSGIRKNFDKLLVDAKKEKNVAGQKEKMVYTPPVNRNRNKYS